MIKKYRLKESFFWDNIFCEYSTIFVLQIKIIFWFSTNKSFKTIEEANEYCNNNNIELGKINYMKYWDF